MKSIPLNLGEVFVKYIKLGTFFPSFSFSSEDNYMKFMSGMLMIY